MSTQSSTPTPRTIFLMLWQAAKPYAWRRNLAIITATLTVLGGLAGPIIIARILHMIQQGELGNTTLLWQLAGLFALCQIWAEIIGWRLTLYFVWTFETAMQRDLYNRAFRTLTQQTLFFHSSQFGGSLVSQTSKLTAAAERFWDTIIWSILPLALSLIGSIIILSLVLWPYAIFLAVFALLFCLVVYITSRPMARLNEAEAAASNALSGRLADTIANIMAVKSSSAETREAQAFAATVTDWRHKSLAVMGGFLRVSTVYSSITTIIKVAALVFAIYAAQHNVVSIATIYLIVTYTTSVTRELWNVNSIMRSYNRVLGDARDMVGILNTPLHLADATSRQLAVPHGKIDIDTITFTHDEGIGSTIFDGFSLTIQPGEKIGLVGASGSGKTTLTKLLLRFADIDKGTIRIDGQAIDQVTQASLREHIAYVAQEPLLFHRTIRENIAYARPDATDEQIADAAKQAGALAFITKLPGGFGTLVGERGIKLSGGQRQRIAIARAILKDAPILILDEAPSALDSESERLIQRSLTNLMKNRTSIVVAHRLSTIASLDRIVVMDNGAIIEQGSHTELLAKGGAYAKLWNHQSGGFIQ